MAYTLADYNNALVQAGIDNPITQRTIDNTPNFLSTSPADFAAKTKLYSDPANNWGGTGLSRDQVINNQIAQQAANKANRNTGFGGMLSNLVSNPVTGLILSAALGPEMGALTGLGDTASAALTGSVIGGGTSALQGQNPLIGALKGGALAGIGSGIANNFGDISSGLGLASADNAGQSLYQMAGFGGGVPATGMPAGGAMSGEAPSGTAPMGSDIYGPSQAITNTGQLPWSGNGALSAGEQGLLNNATSSAANSPIGNIADNSATGKASGFLSGALSKIGQNPLGAAAAALSLVGALGGNKVNGEQTQKQVLAAQQAKAAQDAAFSQQTVNALNSASLGRSPVNPNISDYYTYGTRPEATFFSQANPIHYGS